MTFPLRKISSFAKVKGGKRLPKGADLQDEQTQHPYIRVTDMLDDGLNLSQIKYISREVHDKIKRYTIRPDDVYISIAGTIGRVGMIPKELEGSNLTENAAKITEMDDSINPRFLMYFLRSRIGQSQISSMAGGTSQPKLALYRIGDIELPELPRPIQDNIVSIVKNYDDLIENNKRRIALLEESARQLYKEWFVRFRFPGHEHVKIVDGVPEEWQQLTVAECCEKPTYGYTASADAEPIGPKFLRITDIVPSSIDWSSVPHCLADESTTKKYLLNKGDIVVARTGATVGYAKLMPEFNEEVVYASYLVRFRPKPEIIDEQILGIFVESEYYKEHVRAHAGGAAQPNANAQVLGSAKLNIPPLNLQIQFKNFVEPVFKQKIFLQQNNFSLTKARDLLLPKLMSGELAI